MAKKTTECALRTNLLSRSKITTISIVYFVCNSLIWLKFSSGRHIFLWHSSRETNTKARLKVGSISINRIWPLVWAKVSFKPMMNIITYYVWWWWSSSLIPPQVQPLHVHIDLKLFSSSQIVLSLVKYWLIIICSCLVQRSSKRSRNILAPLVYLNLSFKSFHTSHSVQIKQTGGNFFQGRIQDPWQHNVVVSYPGINKILISIFGLIINPSINPNLFFADRAITTA